MQETEKLTKKVASVLNEAFGIMSDYNDDDQFDRHTYYYNNSHWLRQEYPHGIDEDEFQKDSFEIDHLEPTVTLRPVRKRLVKLMLKLNEMVAKSSHVKNALRSGAHEEKAKAKEESDNLMFDSTCMICCKPFEVC